MDKLPAYLHAPMEVHGAPLRGGIRHDNSCTAQVAEGREGLRGNVHSSLSRSGKARLMLSTLALATCSQRRTLSGDGRDTHWPSPPLTSLVLSPRERTRNLSYPLERGEHLLSTNPATKKEQYAAAPFPLTAPFPTPPGTRPAGAFHAPGSTRMIPAGPFSE